MIGTSVKQERLSEVRTNLGPWHYLRIQQLGIFQTDKYRRILYDIMT